MARYTIELEQSNTETSLGSVRSCLDAELSRRISVHKIWYSIQKNQAGLVLLETDLIEKEFRSLVDKIEQDMRVRLLLKAGWVVPIDMTDVMQLAPKEVDPFFFQISVQSTEVMKYTYDMNGMAHLLLNLVLLGIGVLLVYNGYLYSNVLELLVGMLLTVLFIESFFSVVLYIECNSAGVELRYLLKPKRTLDWTKIQLLRIKHVRAEWCLLQTDLEKIELPLSQVYSPEKKSMLLKTIIARAGLYYFDGPEEIIYRQS